MNFNQLKNHDWIITIVSLILLGLGVAVIFSTTFNSSKLSEGAGTVPRQLVFIVIGLLAYFAISVLDLTWLQNKRILFIFYAFIMLTLIYVKFFGVTIAGTNRWINIGFFSFQPSEYAKIILILITAGIFAIQEKIVDNNLPQFNHLSKLSGFRDRIKNFLTELGNRFPFLKSLLLSLVLCIPLIFLVLVQPALGNAIISLFLWLIILYIISPNQLKLTGMIGTFICAILIYLLFINIHFNDYNLSLSFNFAQINYLYLVGLVILLAAITLIIRIHPLIVLMIALSALLSFFAFDYGWNHVLTNYQKDRILAECPSKDPKKNSGICYQVIQSRIAIGAGRLTGRGFLQGTQSNLNVLTQSHTDFIFAAFSEQFGFIGVLVVLFLYLILILRILKIALESANTFGSIIGFGIASLFLLHIFINIGMNIGSLPVTGIPLLLMSYGGSSVLMTLIGLGLVQSVKSNKRSIDIADDLMLRSRSLTLK